jgi:choline dehydrogenase
MGYPLIPDTSDPDAPADGLATFDVTINDKNQRMSTFNAFIPREVALSREKNLSICTKAMVSRIVWSNKAGDLRATSVEFTTTDPKSSKVFSAKVRKEVIICSGSIGTPQVLMLR